MFFKKSRKELKDKCDDCALDATPASQEEIEMMRTLKKTFDPLNILNPKRII